MASRHGYEPQRAVTNVNQPGPFGWLEVRGGDTEFPGRVQHHGQITAALGPAA
jgi:hypothetical protein